MIRFESKFNVGASSLNTNYGENVPEVFRQHSGLVGFVPVSSNLRF